MTKESRNVHQGKTASQGIEADDIKRWYDLSLPQALVVAVIVSLMVACSGVMIYLNSDERKFDINRPGSQYNPPQLSISDDIPIDTSSSITEQSIKDMSSMIGSQLDKLKPYSNFHDSALDDSTLGLSDKKPDTP